MDWHAVVGIIAGIIQLYSIVPYIKGMLHGETRPNVVSWVLWTLIQVIIIAAQFSAGPSWSIIIPIIMTFNTCLVLILCFWGYGYHSYGIVDIICFVLAIGAIALWRLTNDPVLAICMSVVADLTAGIPTYVKVYREPFSEAIVSWFLLIVANVLALVAASPFNFANTAFSSYIVIVDIIFFFVMVVRRKIVRPAVSPSNQS